MAESSSFFNSFEGDRLYTSAQFVEYFANFVGNGVFWGGSALQVNVRTGMDVQVLTGRAFVEGYYYKNEGAPKVLTLAPAHPTMGRIDRVVLRLDLTQAGRQVTAVVRTGQPSGQPSAPALVRDNAFFELGLADIRVNPGVTMITQSNITDLRLDAALCGVVTGLIKQPDLTEIFNQYQAKFNEVSTHWRGWFGDTQETWDVAFASFASWFAEAQAHWEDGFMAQIKAELFAHASTNFDDWSRRAGFRNTTTFLSNGDVTEVVANRQNGFVLCTRDTVFGANGSVTETVRFTSPELTVRRVTTFTANGVVEDYD